MNAFHSESGLSRIDTVGYLTIFAIVAIVIGWGWVF